MRFQEPPRRALSAQDVLSILRRTSYSWADVDPEVDLDRSAENTEVDLTFETTVSNWSLDCDLRRNWFEDFGILESRSVGRFLNEWFEVDFSNAQWRGVLVPGKKKTMRGVCELIAQRATVRTTEPMRIAGTREPATGTFRALMLALEAKGVPTAGLKPSTPLIPLWDKHCSECIIETVKLTSHVLPKFQEYLPAPAKFSFKTAFGGFGLLLFSWIILKLFGVGVVGCTFAWMMIIFGVVLGYIFSFTQTHAFEFGELQTLGDLARFMARPVTDPDHQENAAHV